MRTAIKAHNVRIVENGPARIEALTARLARLEQRTANETAAIRLELDELRRGEPSPDVQVIQDDSWSTDRITPAGREKLRAAGFAPPAPRTAGAPTLVQLQAKVHRCPYCGSTETKLENIFGPTPCRSLRWCESCRQPFEQFKTI